MSDIRNALTREIIRLRTDTIRRTEQRQKRRVVLPPGTPTVGSTTTLDGFILDYSTLDGTDLLK